MSSYNSERKYSNSIFETTPESDEQADNGFADDIGGINFEVKKDSSESSEASEYGRAGLF